MLNRDQKEAISANNPEDPEATIVQSTFNILNMCVETKWKNGRVTTAYASSFGFTPLNMKNKTKYEEQAPENMPNWLVSDYLNLAECPEPDSGVKVKDISLDLESYSYTYNQVGTYTATFLMNNANYSHVASKTCELIINVTE